MNEKAEIIFADGMIVKKPSEKAPDFVIASLSIKAGEFVEWLKQHDKAGWVNIAVLESRGGKYYAKLDTFEPSKQEEYARGTEQAREAMKDEKPAPPQNNQGGKLASDFDDDIPFS